MSFDAYHVDDATDAAIQKEIDAIFETCWSINHLTYIAAERVRMCGALVGRIQQPFRCRWHNRFRKGMERCPFERKHDCDCHRYARALNYLIRAVRGEGKP